MSFLVQKTVAAKPRAVVLLFGWHGAQLRHVQKYAALYENCTTITGVCSPFSVMTKWAPAIDRFVTEGVHEASRLRVDDPAVPVLVHSFSNGGAFCLERLRILIDKRESEEFQNFKIDVEVFDSAPAFTSFQSATRAMYHGAPNLAAFGAIFIAGFTAFLVDCIVCLLCGKDSTGKAFWKNMKEGGNDCPQGFVYSSADELTDHIKLDELIEFRKKRLQVDVTELKFDDSAHVQHLLAHRSEYIQFIELMIDKAQRGK